MWKPGAYVDEVLLERLDKLDQGERVGAQVVEGRVLGDLARALFEDLGQLVSDQLQNGGSVQRCGVSAHDASFECAQH